ncbi:MAG: hypothetical protein GX154_13070, partial [Clostridiales bacterium]|nr:hypothetical protein [Clostridiales bacterium]
MSQKEELNELLNKILDPKTCIGCGQRKGYTDRNYAGFDVISEGNYPFPQRITPLAIPGVKSKGDYLCFKCVNSFKVNCRVHGIVKDDNFNGARPPRCFKCEAQLNKINKGELPDGFWCLIPLSQIAIGSKTLNNEGILACSDDGEAHIINKGVLLSSTKHFTPQVATANNNVILKLTSFSHKIQSCFIELKNKELLNKGHGPWVNLWNHEIRKKLNLNDQFPSEIVICDIELTKAANGTFDIVREKYPISLLTIENGNFKIYPKIPLPGLKGLTRWHFSSAMQTLQLAINLEGVPHTITLSECFNCAGFGSLHDMSKKMPEYLETSDQDIFNLEGKAVCEVKHFPKYERFKCLFELNSKTKSISATSIPKEKQLTFDLCFSHKQN